LPRFTVLTNNPSAAGKSLDVDVAVEFSEGDVIYVLIRAIELLQNNHRLAPSFRPENPSMPDSPFRSVVIEASEEKFDIKGIEAVELLRKSVVRNRNAAPGGALSERPDDFAATDAQALSECLSALLGHKYTALSRDGSQRLFRCLR
jgi:hypothetical protein